jgi:hypothetical protein
MWAHALHLVADGKTRAAPKEAKPSALELINKALKSVQLPRMPFAMRSQARRREQSIGMER